MKSCTLIILLLLMTAFLLMAFVALHDKAWLESTCFGVWVLILERTITIIDRYMK